VRELDRHAGGFVGTTNVVVRAVRS
jgi:hypothetical protein